VTITPSTGLFKAGDVLTCGSDGYDPIYTWTGSVSGYVIATAPNPFTLPEGPFSLTCTAEVHELVCTGLAETIITDNAYSKYQK